MVTKKTCPDCGHLVVSIARKCRKCAYTFSTMERFDFDETDSTGNQWTKKEKQQLKAALIGFIIILPFIIYFKNIGDSQSETVAPPQELSRDDKIERQFNEWSGNHIEIEKYLKMSLNDPGSLDIHSNKIGDKGGKIYIKIDYSARNGFGGMNRQTILALVDIDGNILSIISNK